MKLILLCHPIRLTASYKNMLSFLKNSVPLLRKLIFFRHQWQKRENVLVFANFDNQWLIFKQNQCDIRNQRQNLSRMT